MTDKDLLIAPCSLEASKFACEHFHYSHSVPPGKLVKHGVWEDGEWIGAILYGDSPNINMHTPYGLDYSQVCELRRIALKEHSNTVTKMVSQSLKLLKKQNPNLELVVSYADTNQDHLGIIYQGGNWIYEGQRPSRYAYIINGESLHSKTVWDRYGRSDLEFIREHIDPNAKTVRLKGKYKYIYPLTKRARRMFEGLHKPYPKSIE